MLVNGGEKGLGVAAGRGHQEPAFVQEPDQPFAEQD